jgi:hypothetical protein
MRTLGSISRRALTVMSVAGAVSLGSACSSGTESSSDDGSDDASAGAQGLDGSGRESGASSGAAGKDAGGPATGADAGKDAGSPATGPEAGEAEGSTATGPDAGTDANGPSSGMDAGEDAGKDASGPAIGMDAGKDASGPASGTDAGKDASGPATGTDSGTSSTSPFDCHFAWGEPVPSGSLSADSWLQFMTSWAGYEIQANGSISTFDNGGFLTQLEPTNLIPVYYTYLIGYYGHANNLPDQNCCGSSCTTCTATQPNLSTGAAYLLLGDPTGANAPCGSTTTFCAKNLIVQAYAYYAQQTHAAWPTKPFVWLMEGDFIQYTDTTQVASLTSTTGASAALTYAQLGQLASLIATAIKTNMPNAVVAFDDSAWISDTDRPLYWQAIAQAKTNYDMVWTTGVGNNPPFLNAGEKAADYDGMTGTYAWLHSYTGKKILVDESAGASQQADTWSNQSAATLNALIADGVAAVNVSGAPSTYQANVTALEPLLDSTCP